MYWNSIFISFAIKTSMCIDHKWANRTIFFIIYFCLFKFWKLFWFFDYSFYFSKILLYIWFIWSIGSMRYIFMRLLIKTLRIISFSSIDFYHNVRVIIILFHDINWRISFGRNFIFKNFSFWNLSFFWLNTHSIWTLIIF